MLRFNRYLYDKIVTNLYHCRRLLTTSKRILMWCDQSSADFFKTVDFYITNIFWKFNFNEHCFPEMINRELVASEWSEKIVPAHNVPNSLFDHQLDAMALLKGGKHVFLGKNLFQLAKTWFFFIGVPTGSGKTLPQLTSILTMTGKSSTTSSTPIQPTYTSFFFTRTWVTRLSCFNVKTNCFISR